jgi:hypothetical protein
VKMSIHSRVELALASLLLLGSCGDGNQFNDKERDEIEDIAGDTAYDTVPEHEKVKELESRIEALEMNANQ